MIKFMFAAALLAIPFSAAAKSSDLPEWLNIDTSETNSVVYARTEDLMKGRSYQTDARVWVRIDASRDRTVDWREMIIFYSINCPKYTYEILHMSTFYRGGRNVTNQVSGKTEYIVPRTIMARTADVLCYTPDLNTPTNYVPEKDEI